MKNNRKKCNLNQLAEIMPIISKNRTRRFHRRGLLLQHFRRTSGTAGDRRKFTNLHGRSLEPLSMSRETGLNSNGASLFNNAKTEWKNNVMSSITGKRSEMYYKYDYYESGNYVGATGIIGMNAYGEVSRSSNYFMIMSVLEHEGPFDRH